jgi:DNA-binding transcriptional LysR family regulator
VAARPPLSKIDLNLLVVLQHLLITSSVARTAVALGLTASAVSHALGRLRKVLGDELFVRSRDGLMPTSRAKELRPVLDDTLGKLERAIAEPTFVPGRAGMTFTLACADFGARATLPALLRELSAQAPGVELVIRPLPIDSVAALESGELDAMVGRYDQPQPSLYKRRLFLDQMVVMARRGHPLIRRGRISLADYLSQGHLQVSPRGRPGSPIDDHLRELGHSRRIVARIPDFLLAPMVVAETDLLTTVSQYLTQSVLPLLPIETAAPPFEISSFAVSLVWHARSHRSAAHRWMRELIVDAYTDAFADD